MLRGSGGDEAIWGGRASARPPRQIATASSVGLAMTVPRNKSQALSEARIWKGSGEPFSRKPAERVASVVNPLAWADAVPRPLKGRLARCLLRAGLPG